MKVNVENFKTVLQKATLNFSIDNVHLNIKPDKIVSRMISPNRDSIVLLDIENNAFSGLGADAEHDFYFSEPNQTLMPFLNLIDDEEADIRTYREKILIETDNGQKMNIHFCSNQIVHIFTGDNAKENTEYFISLPIDNEFLDVFKKIKAIGAYFGKIYFTVKNDIFAIETTDKSNSYSNSLIFNLTDVEYDDITLCFDYKNFSNAIKVIDSDVFTMKFSYSKEQELGLLFIKKSDETENYFLFSRQE